MGKKLAISLFIVAIGASSSMLRAAPNQSLHFNAAAPAGAAAGSDDLRTAIKANGLPPIGSSSIDLVPPTDTAAIVTNKAAQAQCAAAFAASGVLCTVVRFDTFATCNTGPACCDRFIDVPAFAVTASCDKGAGTTGFDLNRPGAATGITAFARPGGVGSVTHYGAENKNIYTGLSSDPGAGTLIQIRPNGITGTIQVQITHNQGGSNPRTASVIVDGTNNDPSESQALHNAIETALEGISPALPVPIVATTHTLDDATGPLTAFGWFKQATHFVEINNMAAAGIQDVRVIVPAGQGLIVEGTDRVTDSVVPTLNEWGIIALVLVLMLCGYVLIRRQKALAATS